jgi:hypothetical protein
MCYVEESRPPLWSSGQSSWLQIQRSRFDFQCYQIFWEVESLERGLLDLTSTIEELLERKSSGSGLETLIMAVVICHADHVALYTAKVGTNLADKRQLLGGIVHSWTQATVFFLLFCK